MEIEKKIFGTLSDGRDISLYTVKVGEMSLSLSTLGATWTSFMLPSKKQGRDDILLGCSGCADYLHNKNYFGVTVGRYANRINGAAFEIDGETFRISMNKPGYSLHGGRMGFPRRLWEAEAYTDKGGAYVRFCLKSPDGDQGYPGNMEAAVTYGLTQDNCLTADYEASVDRACPISLTNHAYFNLRGENSGENVLSTRMKLFCAHYVEVDEDLLPTGRLLPTAGTALDFSQEKAIGKDIAQLTETKIGGYDHCFAVDGTIGELRPFAEVFEPETGRRMSGFTTMPGVQIYTGNMLSGYAGKIGSIYEKNHGLCLETQHFPDAPNQPSFPCAIYGPDRLYHERTEFCFAW